MTDTPQPTVQTLFDLTGKTALITGGAGWLGGAMSSALAEAGASVIIGSSRSAEAAQQVADALPVTGDAVHHGVVIDYGNADSIQKGFEAAAEAAGHIDVLVNNGLSICGKDLTNVTHAEFIDDAAQNAGWFELSRLLRDHAVEHNYSASIIMIGSMYGLVGSYPDAYEGVFTASPVSYHALKGGTVHMTRHLAVYWAKDNVRVNCLNPGPFPTDKIPPEMVRRLRAKCPMNRMGKPHELKGAIVFLASEASSYVTGQSLTVDGGWTAW